MGFDVDCLGLYPASAPLTVACSWARHSPGPLSHLWNGSNYSTYFMGMLSVRNDKRHIMKGVAQCLANSKCSVNFTCYYCEEHVGWLIPWGEEPALGEILGDWREYRTSESVGLTSGTQQALWKEPVWSSYGFGLLSLRGTRTQEPLTGRVGRSLWISSVQFSTEGVEPASSSSDRPLLAV